MIGFPHYLLSLIVFTALAKCKDGRRSPNLGYVGLEYRSLHVAQRLTFVYSDIFLNTQMAHYAN